MEPITELEESVSSRESLDLGMPTQCHNFIVYIYITLLVIFLLLLTLLFSRDGRANDRILSK